MAGGSSPFKVTAFGMFVAGFVFLVAAVAAIAIAQFGAKPLAPWISVGYSAGAVICTVIALFMRRGR